MKQNAIKFKCGTNDCLLTIKWKPDNQDFLEFCFNGFVCLAQNPNTFHAQAKHLIKWSAELEPSCFINLLFGPQIGFKLDFLHDYDKPLHIF